VKSANALIGYARHAVNPTVMIAIAHVAVANAKRPIVATAKTKGISNEDCN